MNHDFKCDALGTDVTRMFPDRVRHKTFVLAGLVRGALAATTADVLTHAGAGCIIFTGRSQPELQTVIDHINRKHPQAKIIFITADTGSLASMRAAAKAIKELDVPIDGIVAFPSVMGAEWELTPDGIESHFQKNYLAYFVLVNELMEKMSSGSRTVLLTTSVRREAPAPKWDDANFSNGETYHSLEGYTQSMFANILLAKSLAQKCSGESMAVFSVNPGNTKSNIQSKVSPEEVSSWLQRKKEAGEDLPILLQQEPKSLTQGSATVLRALLDPVLAEHSGAFLDNSQVLTLPHLDFPAGEESATALWRLSESLVDGAGSE